MKSELFLIEVKRGENMKKLTTAVDKGTINVAEALIKKAAEQLIKEAIKFYKKVGRRKAFAEFSNPKSRFTFRTIYIFVIDRQGVVFAHGQNKNLIGKQLIGLKDSDRKLFIKQIIDAAKVKKSGWVEYKWWNALTKKIAPKQTCFERTGDCIFGCGFTKLSK